MSCAENNISELPSLRELYKIPLHEWQKEQLAVVLKHFYEEMYCQIPNSIRKIVTFEQVVHGAYKKLKYDRLVPRIYCATFLDAYDARPLNEITSDYVLSIVAVMGDVLGMAFQMLGIVETEARSAARELLRDMKQDIFRGFIPVLQEIKESSSVAQIAQLVWTLFARINDILGLNAILRSLRNAMSWGEWIISGSVITAQLSAWFMTDGAAFIEEVKLDVIGLAALMKDTTIAVETCG